jgi:hypothetical protein
MNLIKIALIIAWMLFSIFMNYGCSQRIAEYNPETGVWRYKSNHFATDSQADRVTIRTPSGIVIEIDKAMQDNDSLKASAIVGGVPVGVETK